MSNSAEMQKTADHFCIRSMTGSDWPLAEDFFRHLTPEGNMFYNHLHENEDALKKQLQSPAPDRVDFCAVGKQTDGSEIMLGHIFLWAMDTKIPWLGICLREGAMGKHLGRILLQYLEDSCKARNCGGMMLTTHMANIRAQTLYRNFGFLYLGIHGSGEMLFYKPFTQTGNK